MEQFRRIEHGEAPTNGASLEYEDLQEEGIIKNLARETDFDSVRLKRIVALPDLTRKENSPIKFIVDKIVTLQSFQSFDIVQIPETITVTNNFDRFGFPKNHPARTPSDTYFVAGDRVLRTHTTSMWLYYLDDPKTRELLEKRGWIGELCYGKVYRKDEIDSKHFPVFHQIDGLYISKRSVKEITLKDFQDILSEITRGVFGPQVEFRFLDDDFPYTNPSTQMEIKRGNDWLEIFGAGLVRDTVLENFGFDPKVYNGWAFGFGLERLAMIKNGIPDIRLFWSDDPRITKQFRDIDSRFKEVSKYPEIIRDISFVVAKSTPLNAFYEIVREAGLSRQSSGGAKTDGENLVEEVKKTDEYEDAAKFGADKKSYTFRIVFRSHERTLLNDEINKIHKSIEELVKKELKAEIR